MFARRSLFVASLRPFLAALLLLLSACTDDGTDDSSPDGGMSDVLCEAGTLGCECASGGTCSTDLRGSQLLCQADLCVPADCNAGASGCVCLGGTTCESPGDLCSEGVCKNPECVAGSLSCDCLAGTCNAGLHCDEALGGGTCIDGTGYQGGACLPNRLCYGQNRCDTELSVCVFCEAGSQACAPRGGGLCNRGLVLHAGRCLSPMDVPPSEDERTCRMRCREDYSAAGDFRPCVDGFIDGCIGDLECVDGSCVVPGEDPPTCGGQNDCPDFQRCFGNDRCYSECDGNTDCLDGYSCYRHACRIPCVATNAASAPCPSDMHCDTRDGNAGVCMPLPEPGPAQSTALRASFDPIPNVVALSALTPTFPVTIRTESEIAESYEIVKVAQRVYDASGAELVDPLGAATPLHFVRLTAAGASAGAGGSLRVTAPPRCGDACPVLTIEVTGAPNAAEWARWEGELEIRHATLGERRVRLAYQGSADGRWTGSMYYFASFPEENVAEWRSRDGEPGTGLWDTEDVGNGLIQAWGTFRRGRMTDGVDAFRALLTSTRTESWSWPSVQGFCEEAFGTGGGGEYPGACFLFDGGRGNTLPRRYVDDLASAPIPTGATEYPVAMSVRTTTGESGLPVLEGVIDSAIALHYPGDPRVRIGLERSPFASNACPGAGDCVVYLDSFSADITVGARMAMGAASRCPTSFAPVSFPWLLPDFLGDSDGRQTDECLDQRAPFPRGSNANTNLSLANPFRDGRAIRRELRLMDGALINQRQLFVLFEERFTSSVHSEAFSAFGYMLLDQADQLVEDEVFDAASEAAARADTVSADPGSITSGPSCDPALLADIFGDGFKLPESLAGTVSDPSGAAARAVVGDVVDVMLTGRIGGGEGVVEYTVANGLEDNVHVLCVDNGLIDGGPDAGAPRPCPPVSRTRYFFVPDPYNANLDVRSLACQQDRSTGDAVYEGSCGSQVETWSTSLPGFVLDPLWRCEAEDAVYCSDDSSDPRIGKIFYEATDAAFLPLAPMIQEAFRYKTRFVSGANRSVGFAPEACVGSGSLTPYCYDPVAIEEVVARVDCLLSVYERYAAVEHHHGDWNDLRAFLSSSLSYDVGLDSEGLASSGLLEDGFERLYSELLIMLGDESFTAALSSRFDLAATQNASFLGSQFEMNGIDLSGIAGFEMRSLYRAVQYYDLATDRFYQRIAPVVRAALANGDVGESGDAIVTQGLVTRYLERLIGGSTKRATTWSEIAVRYQSLNRPDLAESVLVRAYTATFLESVALSRLMLGVADLRTNERDIVIAEIEGAQRRYQVALYEMREVLTAVQDDVDVFGVTADYVPFPAVDDSDFRYSNAFEAVLGVARLRMETARRFEDDAIFASREFETDAATFQSELVQIARSYEDRLQSLCGVFRGRDGRVYPAITKYADLSDATAAMGDSPCGRIGNGEIHERIGDLTLLDDERLRIETRMRHVLAEKTDEQARAREQCARIDEHINEWTTMDNQRIDLQALVNGMQTTVSTLDRGFNTLAMGAGATDVFGKVAVAIGGAAYMAGAGALEISIAAKQTELMRVEQGIRNLEMEQECAALTIDSAYRVKAILRSAIEVELEALQLAHRAALVFSAIDRLFLEAQRIEEQQSDSEQLAVDVQGARNDPNIRVYRNSAVLNADRSFDRALEHAYRATRMYEYYTSQTYAGRDELYLIRMVARGTHNLVSYLDDLEDDYEAFRVEYRTRAHRVRRISLLNDVFQIPYQAAGRELGEDARLALMRERLLDPSRVDANGHRVVEFRTLGSQTAPCTFNHQIDYVEVDIIGQNLGDEFANILLWQDGTGVIEPVAGDPVYYRLPPALVVAQPHFNNSQRFDPSIYRRFELRERPFVNTSWKLVFDQHSDPDNQDISVAGLKDIHIYVHYTDFTDPGACR